MNLSRITIVLAVLLALVSVSRAGEREVIDKIAAVAGDYIILESELDFQLQLWAMQQPNRQVSESELAGIRDQILEQMVNDKLILIRALKDTTIDVPSERVEAALNEKIDELKGRFPSQAEFERQLLREGLTFRDLKSKFRDEMRNQLYKDQLISRELSTVSVTSSEITEFFETYRDSLPPHPEAVKISHVLLEVEPSESTLEGARLRAEEVKRLIDEGHDFAELAMEYSDDPSGSSGGDLGFFNRGDLVPEFERAAYALEVGGISDIVLTQFGYHIIKLEEKQSNRIRCRHILFLTNPSEEDKASTMALADSIIERAKAGEDFADLVKEYSADDESKKLGGELGWFVFEDMTPEFKLAVHNLSAGEYSAPTESRFGIHVLKVQDRQTSRPWAIEDDLDKLRELARRQKTEEVVTRLIGELKEEIYVDIRSGS